MTNIEKLLNFFCLNKEGMTENELDNFLKNEMNVTMNMAFYLSNY